MSNSSDNHDSSSSDDDLEISLDENYDNNESEENDENYENEVAIDGQVELDEDGGEEGRGRRRRPKQIEMKYGKLFTLIFSYHLIISIVFLRVRVKGREHISKRKKKERTKYRKNEEKIKINLRSTRFF